MHDHYHNHESSSSKIGFAFFLNLSFAIAEFFGGMFTNSLAITSDALHDFGDSISLGISWLLEKKSRQKRSNEYSYGYGRFSLLGAIISGSVLTVGSIIIIIKIIQRTANPESINVKGMLVFAILGVIINGLAALKLKNYDTKNTKFVFYHMLEDVLGWVAVLISSIVMMFVDFPYIDTVLSILIVGYVLFNVVKNLLETFGLFLQKVPEEFDLKKLKRELTKKFLCEIHDLHIWTLDGENNILSAHLALSKNCTLKESDIIKSNIKTYLEEKGINHSTIEVECRGNKCEQANC